MCGISGWWASGGAGWPDEAERQAARAVASRMAAALAHRGPDDTGVWLEDQCGLALIHRRLAILDLSPAGRQPMASACGRFVLVFNGEIYNHLEIREELRAASAVAPAWRGHSDTETVLAGIASWGLERLLARSVGMFALALWDRQERVLTLARDRLGEKPLYYGWQGETFLFASELKALRAHPAFEGRVDRHALGLFLRYNYVPSPWSIYQGIHKLPPGSVAMIRPEKNRVAELKRYWSAQEIVASGQHLGFTGDDLEARMELEGLLRRSVASQMVADVPLGAFLSGGLDSSTIVALMQAQSDRPVKTFTIGFHSGEYDEAAHAKAVAAHLGTDHTELYVTPKEALEIIPRLPHLYDEPFADSSQIPTFLVAQLARQHVTVALSGDGGDELLGGYHRHYWMSTWWPRLASLPRWLRKPLAGACTALPSQAWNRVFRFWGKALPASWQHAVPGDKLYKLATILPSRSPMEAYCALVSHWTDPASVLVNGREFLQDFCEGWAPPAMDGIAHKMMYLDLITYLPDDILTKVDRATMGVSLEARVPFLDHRLVEFVWRLPLAMKIRNGQGKWLLRQILHQYVPQELVERPKMGFAVPVDEWLRGSLRNWAEGLISVERLQREGFFHPEPIRQKWAEHLSGRRNWASHLWSVLMFQAWLDATS